MANANYVELNPYRPLVVTVEQAGVAVNLSTTNAINLTLLNVEDQTTVLVNHQPMSFVSDGTDGQIKYQLTAAQLSATSAGTYKVQIEIQWTVGGAYEAVDMAEQRVVVKEHYGSHPS